MAAAVGCCLFDTAIGRCGIAWTAEGAIQAVQLPETGDARTLARMRERCGQDVPEADAPEAIAPVIARLQRLLEGDRERPVLLGRCGRSSRPGGGGVVGGAAAAGGRHDEPRQGSGQREPPVASQHVSPPLPGFRSEDR